MLTRIRNSRRKITPSAPAGDSIPKNTIDQRRFTASCIRNQKVARRTDGFSNPDFRTNHQERPIRMYKIVHAGANTQLGGENQGLFRVTNHPVTWLMVKYEPIKPIKRGRSIAGISKR